LRTETTKLKFTKEFKVVISVFLDKYGAHVMPFSLAVLFSFLSPAFASLKNLENLLRQSSFIGILSLGLSFVVMCGGIDLSISGVFALSSTLCALWQHHGIYLGYVDNLSFLFPPYLIFLICTLIGSGIGLLQSLVITKANVPDFIVTLGTMITLRSLAFSSTGGQTVFGVSEETKFLGSGSIWGVPFPVFAWFLLIVLAHIVLKNTSFGYELAATGQSREAAKICGRKIR